MSAAKKSEEKAEDTQPENVGSYVYGILRSGRGCRFWLFAHLLGRCFR